MHFITTKTNLKKYYYYLVNWEIVIFFAWMSSAHIRLLGVSWKGPPAYEVANGARKLVHTTKDGVTYKWCGSILCLDKESGDGMWKPLGDFYMCKSRWDQLETQCKICSKYKKSAEARNRKKCVTCNKWGDVGDFQGTECSACTQKPPVPQKKERTIYIIQDGKEGRICKGCNIWMSIEGGNFKIKGYSKDGRTQYETRCRGCSKAYKEALPDLKKQAEEEKVANTGMQKCNKCNTWKDFAEYRKNKLRPSGFDIYCRLCLSKDGEDSKMLGKPARMEHILIDGKLGKNCKICKTWKSFEDKNFKLKATKNNKALVLPT